MGIFKKERVWVIVYEMLWKDLVVDNGMLNVGIDNKSKQKFRDIEVLNVIFTQCEWCRNISSIIVQKVEQYMVALPILKRYPYCSKIAILI